MTMTGGSDAHGRRLVDPLRLDTTPARDRRGYPGAHAGTDHELQPTSSACSEPSSRPRSVLGLLGAGLLMPVVGATGAVAARGWASSTPCRASFTAGPLAQQSRILAADGYAHRDALRREPHRRPAAPRSRRSCTRPRSPSRTAASTSTAASTPRASLRAAVSNLQGGDTQGASTLTQQYVKITLQENALRNNDKEAAQAAVAARALLAASSRSSSTRVDAREEDDQGPDPAGLPQPRLLRRPGLRRRGRRAALLRRQRHQAQPRRRPPCWPASSSSPSATDPVHFPEAAQARRNVVLDRMHDLRLITDKDWTAAKGPVKKIRSR